jgi:predicted DNA-binding transcriptional regulator AlpA
MIAPTIQWSESKMHLALNTLPESALRRRLVNTETAAEYVDRSVPEIRRLVRGGKFPKPIKLNGRRLSWRLGDLMDYVDNKSQEK